MDEKETNHPAHPMDRMANWCSHEGWFTLAPISQFSCLKKELANKGRVYGPH